MYMELYHRGKDSLCPKELTICVTLFLTAEGYLAQEYFAETLQMIFGVLLFWSISTLANSAILSMHTYLKVESTTVRV